MKESMKKILSEQLALVELEILLKEKELSDLKVLQKAAKKALESIDQITKGDEQNDGQN